MTLAPVQINSIPTPWLTYKPHGGSPPPFADGIALENNSGVIQLETGSGFVQLES